MKLLSDTTATYIIHDVAKNFKSNPGKSVLENKQEYFQKIIERYEEDVLDYNGSAMYSFFKKSYENIKRRINEN